MVGNLLFLVASWIPRYEYPLASFVLACHTDS
jgi:hypothetical protein